jgi:hypothetical protein
MTGLSRTPDSLGAFAGTTGHLDMSPYLKFNPLNSLVQTIPLDTFYPIALEREFGLYVEQHDTVEQQPLTISAGDQEQGQGTMLSHPFIYRTQTILSSQNRVCQMVRQKLSLSRIQITSKVRTAHWNRFTDYTFTVDIPEFPDESEFTVDDKAQVKMKSSDQCPPSPDSSTDATSMPMNQMNQFS